MPTRSPIVGLLLERRSTEGEWYHNKIIPLAQEILDPNLYFRYRLVAG